METVNSNGCSIINASDSSISILSAFDESDTIKTVYEDQLTLLPTTDEQKTISNGETKTVNLTGNYFTLNGQKIPSTIYDLLSVIPNSLFPIKNSTVNKLGLSYPHLRVTKEDKASMVLAYQFYQKILAYPTSNLAQGFTNALKGILNGNASSKGDIQSITDGFFQGTTLYKSLNFIAVSTIMSYAKNRASSWAGNQLSSTYYLYYPGNNKNATATQAPNFEGEVIFTKKSTSTIEDPMDPNSGYDITFKEAGGSITSLTYKQGQFYSNGPNVIYLQPSFTTKSRLTNNPKDNQIIPILNGNINGVSVFGTQTKQDLSGSNSESSWYAFWHPKNFQQWINLFVSLGGIAAGIQIIVQGVMSIYKKLAKKFTPKPEREDILKKVNQELEDLRDQLQKIQDRLGPGEIPDQAGIEESIQEGRAALAAQTSFQEALVQTEILSNQNNVLNEYAEIEGVTEQIEESSYEINNAMGSTQTALDQFSAAKTPQEVSLATDQLDSSITSNIKTIPNITETLNQVGTQVESELSDQAQANIEASNKAIEELEEARKAVEEMREESEKGEGADDPDVEGWSDVHL